MFSFCKIKEQVYTNPHIWVESTVFRKLINGIFSTHYTSTAPGGGRPSHSSALSRPPFRGPYAELQDLRPALRLLWRTAEGKGCLQTKTFPLDSGGYSIGIPCPALTLTCLRDSIISVYSSTREYAQGQPLCWARCPCVVISLRVIPHVYSSTVQLPSWLARVFPWPRPSANSAV